MKSHKLILISVLLLGFSLLCHGGSLATEDRPTQLAPSDWIKISDAAGLAVTKTSGDKIIGKLYVKRGERWFEVSVENSPRVVQ